MAGSYQRISFWGVPSTPTQPLAARQQMLEALARDAFDVLYAGEDLLLERPETPLNGVMTKEAITIRAGEPSATAEVK